MRSGNSRTMKEKPMCPKLPPPSYGRKREGFGGPDLGAPPASQKTPPPPTTLAFLMLPGPSLPACLLPSSWQAACWEPVAIETRPRRMLQDPGKRDALMCSPQPALCTNPHPEKEKAGTYPHCLPCGLHLGTCPGRGLHLSFLDYWINLLSDTAASTQNSTEEEQWIVRQTGVLTLALLLCAFGRPLTLHLGLHLGHLVSIYVCVYIKYTI